MSLQNGTVAPSAYANPNTPYYIPASGTGNGNFNTNPVFNSLSVIGTTTLNVLQVNTISNLNVNNLTSNIVNANYLNVNGSANVNGAITTNSYYFNDTISNTPGTFQLASVSNTLRLYNQIGAYSIRISQNSDIESSANINAGNITVTDDLNILGNTQLNFLEVEQNINANNLSILYNSTLNTLVVNQNTQLNNLNVTGTITGNINVSDNITANNITVTQNINANNLSILYNGTLNTLIVNQNTQLNNLNVTGTVTGNFPGANANPQFNTVNLNSIAINVSNRALPNATCGQNGVGFIATTAVTANCIILCTYTNSNPNFPPQNAIVVVKNVGNGFEAVGPAGTNVYWLIIDQP